MKYGCPSCKTAVVMSHPARGAWIEIRRFPQPKRDALVAPRTGCVD